MLYRAVAVVASGLAWGLNAFALAVLSVTSTLDGSAKVVAATAALVGSLTGALSMVLAHRRGAEQGRAAASAEAMAFRLLADEYRRELVAERRQRRTETRHSRGAGDR